MKFKRWSQICGPNDFGCEESPMSISGWELQVHTLNPRYKKKDSFLFYDYHELCKKSSESGHRHARLTKIFCWTIVPRDFLMAKFANIPLNKHDERLTLKYKEFPREEISLFLRRAILGAILFIALATFCSCTTKNATMEKLKKEIAEKRKYATALREMKDAKNDILTRYETDLRKIELRQKILESTIAETAQQNARLEHEKKLLIKKKEKHFDNECIVCMESEKTHALVPCGHCYYCKECAKAITKCCVCRRKIESVIKIFSS